jgi:hypothetical protein
MSCGKKIMVNDGVGNHGSFCGCTYKGLHLCEDCENKKGAKKPEEIWMEKEQLKMKSDEKLYLLISLLKDMRGDWSSNIDSRVNKIIELGEELGHKQVVKSAKDYMRNVANGDSDGRWFRDSWENGGYENAPIPNLQTFSRELLIEIYKHLNYPEYGLPEE